MDTAPHAILTTAFDSACPVCGGPLANLQSFCRCQRCFYVLCENCEGGIESADLVVAPDCES